MSDTYFGSGRALSAGFWDEKPEAAGEDKPGSDNSQQSGEKKKVFWDDV